MTTTTIPAPLSGADEHRLARQIEAGVIARHLLEQGGPPPGGATAAELAILQAEGEAAWEQFLLANTGLVRACAHRGALASGLPEADLFQEGFLGLAEAVRRFDHTRGIPFGGYATFWVRWAVSLALASRLNARSLPIARQRRLRRLRDDQQRLSQAEGRTIELTEAAARSGYRGDLGAELAALQVSSLEALREVGGVPEPAAPEAEPEADAMAWLAALPEPQRTVLGLRYGLAGPPLSRERAAARLGCSVRRVRALEAQALEALRGRAAAAA